jgi:hypothetical protein
VTGNLFIAGSRLSVACKAATLQAQSNVSQDMQRTTQLLDDELLTGLVGAQPSKTVAPGLQSEARCATAKT